MPRAKSKPSSGISINANTVVGLIGTLLTTAFGAAVVFMVNGTLSNARDSKKALTDLTVEVPQIKTSVSDTNKKVEAVQVDVKDVKATAVTRAELDTKHNRLQDSIKEVKADVKEIAVKQEQVKDKLIEQELSNAQQRPKPKR
jgi:uncharacterized protein YlxW (UPF0749 family)